MSNISIEYDGAYPNLCRGSLVVTVDSVRWQFPQYCMSSGGSVGFTEDWRGYTTEGKWSITEWPALFPKQMKQAVVDKVNEIIERGCCGGCL